MFGFHFFAQITYESGGFIYYFKFSISVLPRIFNVSYYKDSNYNYSNFKSDHICITLIKEGVTEFTVFNGYKFMARPGDIFVGVPGLACSWKTEKNVHSQISLNIYDNLNYEILDEKDILSYRYLLNTDKTNALENNFIILPFLFNPIEGLDLEKKINSMYMEFSNQNICTSLVILELFLNIATTISRLCITKPLDSEKTDFKPSYNYIYSRKIIEYLNNNYMNDLDISFLASSLNLNQNYMCNIFRKTTNCTLINYLNKLRINKAKELMLSSSCKINAICKEVGIESEYYFSRLFKKHEGITPKQYRSSFLSLPFRGAKTLKATNRLRKTLWKLKIEY